MRRFLMVLACLGAVGGAPALRAQEPAVTPQQQAARDSLERRVRQRMGQVLRRELGLSDDQMRRLEATNRRFEPQRRALFLQEREVRGGLRDEMMSGDTTRQVQVAGLLDQMLVLQRHRLELLEAEQKELATFLSPIQRAKYFGLEEQIRRRADAMREQGAPPGGRRPGLGTPRPGAGGQPGGARRPPVPR